ncbi:uncharacterized protein LOC109000481 isoform X2 [Juglans regia]|uniref:Uncharacterized protein LOC109000481 isoform X2 n=1 Tax=Juglans regia TaxID=51240 RepID=A0A6P9F2U7_JUGRE|nr:uncharacterized protein LOC109000481 isoform X2 [Juglans regia]
MRGDEARTLLGFPPNSRPTLPQISEAYSCLLSVAKEVQCVKQENTLTRRWERISVSMQIPDFVSAKADFGMDLAIGTRAEFDPGARGEGSASVTNARVVRTGVPRAQGGRGNPALIGVPFLFIILGTIGLGGLNAARAYKKQKEEYPSHNPFLP